MTRYVPAVVLMMILLPGVAGRFARAEPLKADACLRVAAQLKAEADLTQNEPFKKRLLNQAAQMYRQCAELATGSAAEQALLSAAEAHLAIGDEEALAAALAATFVLTEAYPQSKLAPAALLVRGKVFDARRDYGRALKYWDEVAGKHGASPVAAEALYVSGQVYQERIRNRDEAIRMYSSVIEKYGRSDWADDALMARAGQQERADKYEEAIADCLKLADAFPQSALADQAMFQAVTLCESRLKDPGRAHELVLRFKSKFPHSAYLKKVEAIEARTVKYAR
jgi:TolA-binding protein